MQSVLLSYKSPPNLHLRAGKILIIHLSVYVMSYITTRLQGCHNVHANDHLVAASVWLFTVLRVNTFIYQLNKNSANALRSCSCAFTFSSLWLWIVLVTRCSHDVLWAGCGRFSGWQVHVCYTLRFRIMISPN